jgi:hypothetical protein
MMMMITGAGTEPSSDDLGGVPLWSMTTFTTRTSTRLASCTESIVRTGVLTRILFVFLFVCLSVCLRRSLFPTFRLSPNIFHNHCIYRTYKTSDQHGYQQVSERTGFETIHGKPKKSFLHSRTRMCVDFIPVKDKGCAICFDSTITNTIPFMGWFGIAPAPAHIPHNFVRFLDSHSYDTFTGQAT